MNTPQEVLQRVWRAEGHEDNVVVKAVMLELLLAGEVVWHPLPMVGRKIVYRLNRQKPAEVHYNQRTRQFEIWQEWPRRL